MGEKMHDYPFVFALRVPSQSLDFILGLVTKRVYSILHFLHFTQCQLPAAGPAAAGCRLLAAGCRASCRACWAWRLPAARLEPERELDSRL